MFHAILCLSLAAATWTLGSWNLAAGSNKYDVALGCMLMLTVAALFAVGIALAILATDTA